MENHEVVPLLLLFALVHQVVRGGQYSVPFDFYRSQGLVFIAVIHLHGIWYLQWCYQSFFQPHLLVDGVPPLPGSSYLFKEEGSRGGIAPHPIVLTQTLFH